MTAAPDRLSVGFDATPLLGRPTGVGVFCAGALAGLAERCDLVTSAYAVSWRRRRRDQLAERLPAGIASRQRPMPARPLHLARGRGSPGSTPGRGRFIGSGTTWCMAPTLWCRRRARAARVVTVHDLTVKSGSSGALASPATDARLCGPHPAGGGRGGVGAHHLAFRGRPGDRRVRRRSRSGPGRPPITGSPAYNDRRPGVDPETAAGAAPIALPEGLPPGTCWRSGTDRTAQGLSPPGFGLRCGLRRPPRRCPGHRGRLTGWGAERFLADALSSASPARSPVSCAPATSTTAAPGRGPAQRCLGAGLPIPLRGLRVPPAAGHGRRRAGRGHGRRCGARGGRRRCRAGAAR